ncbi:MAG: efflux RND transporter periplasmic adaptor subunit [Melioribacteraceae bacterium]|nr:efflux RND transporter periplasmic adaptor subunit [Melioribacteraceae bacterium]
MKSNKLNIILALLLIISLSFIFYQNVIDSKEMVSTDHEETQLYTCGMHPDIISEEPGNCPICEMKLTPIKSDNRDNGEKTIAYWVAPMDPNEIYDSPGKSKMGMDLVPVYQNEIDDGSIVTIDSQIQQNMNVKISTLKERKLSTSIRTNAIIKSNETKEFAITSRVSGWIEQLSVNFEGQQINKGQKLLEIYSPELVSAQQEYLSALEYQKSLQSSSNGEIILSGEKLVQNSIKKLELLEMSENDIKQVAANGQVSNRIPIYSPVTGFVMKKDILEGDKIKVSDNLMHVTDLSNVWIFADIYENDFAKIKLGAKVNIKIAAFPNQTFEGKVGFINPKLDPKSRTIKVRIEIPNKDFLLKPAMLAEVNILGEESQSYPVIEVESVIRSGEKNIAVLALGEGKFKPVEIKLGLYSDGYYQVLEGLQEGNKIVSSAQFLIDSESNLKSALKQFSSNNTGKTSQVENANSIVKEKESPLVRSGTIDVESIDQNTDGKLYECPMDWNLLSDEEGRCPLCEMHLKEYSISDVKKNLKKHGYEFKK